MNKKEYEKLKNRITNYFYTIELDRSDWYKLLDYIDNLQQENIEFKQKLLEKMCSDKDVEYRKRIKIENNWNKLKEYIGKEWYCYDNDSIEFEVSKDILNKMQELEKGDSNEDI